MRTTAMTVWVVWVWSAFCAVAPGAETAEAIYKAAGARSGLVVHLGCGEGKLTAALRVNQRYLVHGLDTDAGNIAAARDAIHAKGLYQVGTNVVCLDLKTGKPLWKTGSDAPADTAGKEPPKPATDRKGKKRRPRKAPASTILVHGKYVLYVGAKGLTALSADSGKVIWEGKE